MNDKDYAVYQAVQRVSSFGKTHSAAFVSTSNAAIDFARVAPLLEEIGAPKQISGTPASPATGGKAALFDEVWEDLLAIADTARTIALKVPGFAASFRLGENSQREILATAESFLANLQSPATVAKFVACSMPENFVTDLQSDLKAIGEKGSEQDEDYQDATGETARIRILIKEARGLLKSLNTSVNNRFRRDPEILAQWQTAARIHRGPRGNEEPVAVPAPAIP